MCESLRFFVEISFKHSHSYSISISIHRLALFFTSLSFALFLYAECADSIFIFPFAAKNACIAISTP
jgi:hypothetical protein